MPMSELVYWMAFYREDPWGEQRSDYRNGQAIMWALRAAGIKKKVSPHDFMDFRMESRATIDETDPNAAHPIQGILERAALDAKAADARAKSRNRAPRTRR